MTKLLEGNLEKPEPNLHQTMDAMIWANKFLEIFRILYPDIENCCIKKSRFEDFSDWIHSWFCNLIMTGYDHAHSERDKRYVYILQSNSGGIVDIWNNGVEPDELEMKKSYQKYLNANSSVEELELPNVTDNCTLYRYNRYEGLQCWNGKIESETKYNWK